MRNNCLKCALVSTLLTGAFIVSAGEASNSTYVGAEAIYSSMGFKKDYGANLFAKNAPGLNFFVGHMFHENFGAEVGFEWFKKKKRTDVNLNTGEVVAGGSPLTNPVTVNTSFKQQYPYLALIGKTNFDENNFVSLSLGLDLAKHKSSYVQTKDNGASVSRPSRNFNKTKMIPFVKASYEYKFNQDLGLKASLGWKNTARVKTTAAEHNALEVRPKNSLNFGIGLNWYVA